MRKFLIVTVKWLVLIAILGLLGFAGWRFYQNRQLAMYYTGDQSYLQTGSIHDSRTVGISSRAASLAIYAPVNMLSNQGQNIQVKRYDSDQEMWSDFFQDKLEYIFVSLDQYALHRLSQPCQIIFPYAISQGADIIVCSPSWDKLAAGEPRRVAYVCNTTSAYVAQYLYNQRMDSECPVQLVGASTAVEALELLKSGQVEAASLCQSQASNLLSQGFTELPDWTPPTIYEVCVGRDHHATNYRVYVAPIYREFTVGLFNALDKMQTMPGPLYTQIARTSSMSRDDVRELLGKNITFLDGTKAFYLVDDGTLLGELRQALEFWLMSGFYAAPLEAKMLASLDDSILISASLRSLIKIKDQPMETSSGYRETEAQNPAPDAYNKDSWANTEDENTYPHENTEAKPQGSSGSGNNPPTPIPVESKDNNIPPTPVPFESQDGV